MEERRFFHHHGFFTSCTYIFLYPRAQAVVFAKEKQFLAKNELSFGGSKILGNSKILKNEVLFGKDPNSGQQVTIKIGILIQSKPKFRPTNNYFNASYFSPKTQIPVSSNRCEVLFSQNPYSGQQLHMQIRALILSKPKFWPANNYLNASYFLAKTEIPINSNRLKCEVLSNCLFRATVTYFGNNHKKNVLQILMATCHDHLPPPFIIATIKCASSDTKQPLQGDHILAMVQNRHLGEITHSSYGHFSAECFGGLLEITLKTFSMVLANILPLKRRENHPQCVRSQVF